MTIESQGPRDPVESRGDADPGPEAAPLAARESNLSGGTKRWLIAAAVVVLLVYPTARWLMSWGGGVTPAEAEALQVSFQQYQEGRFEEAIASAKAALAANPDSADAYNNIAVSYLGLQKFDEAIEAAQQAIRLQPTYQLAKNNLAWIEQEKTKAAAPPISPAQVSLANTLLSQSLQHAQARHFKECMEAATEATKLNPASAPAFNNLGFCAANLQLWDEAIRNTTEALRLDPNFQLARNNLAWMQQEQSKAAGTKGK